jgi:hypothetical protein
MMGGMRFTENSVNMTGKPGVTKFATALRNPSVGGPVGSGYTVGSGRTGISSTMPVAMQSPARAPGSPFGASDLMRGGNDIYKYAVSSGWLGDELAKKAASEAAKGAVTGAAGEVAKGGLSGGMAGGLASMGAGAIGNAVGGKRMGGAASGAVTGAQIAGPWGALAGGVLGALMG